MTRSQRVLQQLARVPLLQAPMAGVATPQLAAAVSNAGALGGLGLGASSVAQARQAIRDTAALTAAPFQVNVFCHAPAEPDPAREAAWLQHLAPLFAEHGGSPPAALKAIYRSFVQDDAALRMLIEEKPAVVSFHFGLPPATAIDALRDAGIFTLATATSLDEARAIERAGVDGLVAQGIEAGGHRGIFDPDGPDEGLGTSVLVRLLVKHSPLPVIAAGGIMDGAGIRAALDLGAVGAQLGTAFILCPESSASPHYRSLLRGERPGSPQGARHTRLTAAISGRPARGLVTRFFTQGHAPGAPRPAGYPMAYDAGKQLHALAAAAGSHEFGAHWAGQGAPLARELPAAQLVATLLDELGN